MTDFRRMLLAAAVLVVAGTGIGFAQTTMMKPPSRNEMGQAANPPSRDTSGTAQPADKPPPPAAVDNKKPVQ